jgi:transposase
VEVYPGNAADPATVIDQVDKLQERFQLSQVALAGNCGMLTQPQTDKLKDRSGLGWITALTNRAIRKLAARDDLQLSLLDERNPVEITSAGYPKKRLMVCYNPLLAGERAQAQSAGNCLA